MRILIRLVAFTFFLLSLSCNETQSSTEEIESIIYEIELEFLTHDSEPSMDLVNRVLKHNKWQYSEWKNALESAPKLQEQFLKMVLEHGNRTDN